MAPAAEHAARHPLFIKRRAAAEPANSDALTLHRLFVREEHVEREEPLALHRLYVREPEPQENSGLRLFARDDGASKINPIYIAGFAAAGLLVIGLVCWLGVRLVRNKSRAQRDETRGGAFLNVKGLVREDGIHEKSEPLPETLQALQSNTFSRANLTSGVVLPSKTLALPTPKRTPALDADAIIAQHRASGTFPRPFAPAKAVADPFAPFKPADAAVAPVHPFTFALASRFSVASLGTLPSRNSASFGRDSFLSVSSRYSTASAASSASGKGLARKVHQVFTPVLPDELLITRVGEKLTVLQSFDDGWCVVGRGDGAAAKAPKEKGPFGGKGQAEDGVELGVIPAWCFVKPVKGLRAERPVRSSSLGITVEIDQGSGARDDIISWSNF